jgi:hypothetical protein
MRGQADADVTSYLAFDHHGLEGRHQVQVNAGDIPYSNGLYILYPFYGYSGLSYLQGHLNQGDDVMTSPTILVTGATGTTGGTVIRQLSAAGVPARALTRNPTKAQALAKISFVAGDLSDPARLKAAFAGVDAVYLNVVPGTDALTQIDNAIAAAKAAGVSRIVKLSGLNATPQSASGIIRMHAEADARVRASG